MTTILIPESVDSLLNRLGVSVVDIQTFSPAEKNSFIDENLLPIICNPDSTEDEVDDAEYVIDLMFRPVNHSFDELTK